MIPRQLQTNAFLTGAEPRRDKQLDCLVCSDAITAVGRNNPSRVVKELQEVKALNRVVMGPEEDDF